jgi:hypothetical protein
VNLLDSGQPWIPTVERFVVRADEKLTAFMELESAICNHQRLAAHGSAFQVLHGLRVADSVDRIISIISLSLCRSDPVTSSTTPSQYASSGVSW